MFNRKRVKELENTIRNLTWRIENPPAFKQGDTVGPYKVGSVRFIPDPLKEKGLPSFFNDLKPYWEYDLINPNQKIPIAFKEEEVKGLLKTETQTISGSLEERLSSLENSLAVLNRQVYHLSNDFPNDDELKKG